MKFIFEGNLRASKFNTLSSNWDSCKKRDSRISVWESNPWICWPNNSSGGAVVRKHEDECSNPAQVNWIVWVVVCSVGWPRNFLFMLTWGWFWNYFSNVRWYITSYSTSVLFHTCKIAIYAHIWSSSTHPSSPNNNPKTKNQLACKIILSNEKLER